MEHHNSIRHEERSDGTYGSGHWDARSEFLHLVSVEVPAARYFEALEGPELEVLRDCENVAVPPVDKKMAISS